MNRRVSKSSLIFLSVFLPTLLQGCGPEYFSRSLPPACATLDGQGSIKVPECFNESREGEACDPKPVAKAKEDVKVEQVAEAEQAPVRPVASCR